MKDEAQALTLNDQIGIAQGQLTVIKQSVKSKKQLGSLQQKQNAFKIKKMKDDILVKQELLEIQTQKCSEIQEVALEICKTQKVLMALELQRTEEPTATAVSYTAGKGSGRRSSARLAGPFVNEEIEKKSILNGIN